ncbi:CPBP family intramembrane metalloprotease [Cryobacterium sp. 1639]|uniref:CPBP family intramembrane glutamic endopeptidase n=1 Tax=Cryobacterium inferilacus TaxID=2866629 RepID=UPI001C734B05|nr:CPBP family intramembrane glutamic endopeptidase [Cryobacterium sp. 1639]MBX0301527.1 CPBP family intramembrane metalloprotease [Cryobacterium sp. 1639]
MSAPIQSDQASASARDQSDIVPATVPWTAVVVFIVLACGLAWVVALPLWLDGSGLANPLAALLLPVIMFTPGIAALFVVFMVQRPRPRPIAEYLGLWPLRPVGRTIWMTVFGIVGSALLVIVGVFLAAALGLVQLDLVNFSGFAQVLQAASTVDSPIPVGAIVLVQLLLIPFAALLNGVLALGEEIGWRGWLLQSLRPLGTWPALLISGVVWGFWHSPLILLGYNFGQPNLFGVGLMIGGCMFYGVLLGWMRLRTGSIWPAVFAHGAFNAAAGFLLLVVAANTSADPVATGPLGWVTWIVMAVVIVLLVLTGQFRTQPRLQRRPATHWGTIS